MFVLRDIKILLILQIFSFNINDSGWIKSSRYALIIIPSIMLNNNKREIQGIKGADKPQAWLRPYC